MSEQKAYRVPPIIEATIEFRHRDTTPRKMIEAVSRKLRSRYPNQSDDLEGKMEFQPAEGLESKMRFEFGGRRIITSDQSRLIVLQPNSLIFSTMAPYPGWDELSENLRSDYDRIKEETGPLSFLRVGMRYINRMDFPVDKFPVPDPAVGLNYSLNVPNFGQVHTTGFLWQTSYILDNPRMGLNLAAATAESPVPNMWSMLLDIDVSVDVDIPQRPDDLWRLLALMRERKNLVFESSISDAYRQVIS